jgi:phospholipid/cholesterol/gamma-HCH transport system substrate-binding protein
MRGNIVEAVIGGVVLVVTSFFIYFAYTSRGERIDHGYALSAWFDDVTGLSVGSDVRMNGIKVGIVQSLEIDENYMVCAEILVKASVKVPKDSCVSIMTNGLIGSKFAAIQPGVSSESLSEGGMIEETRSSVNLEGLLNKFLFGDKKSERGKETN